MLLKNCVHFHFIHSSCADLNEFIVHSDFLIRFFLILLSLSTPYILKNNIPFLTSFSELKCWTFATLLLSFLLIRPYQMPFFFFFFLIDCCRLWFFICFLLGHGALVKLFPLKYKWKISAIYLF